MIEARDEGQAAVELALVLPLLVALLLAVVQVTLVARDQVLVVHSARAGARQAAVDPEPSGVRRAALEAAGLKRERLEVETSHMGPGRDTVIVRVRYRSMTDVALVGPFLPDVVLEASAAMRAEMSGSGRSGAGNIAAKQESVRSTANPHREGERKLGRAILGPRPVHG